MSRSRKQIIEATVRDAVTDLLYYDRKEDESLPVGAIAAAVDDREVTIGDIVWWFEHELRKGLERG